MRVIHRESGRAIKRRGRQLKQAFRELSRRESCLASGYTVWWDWLNTQARHHAQMLQREHCVHATADQSVGSEAAIPYPTHTAHHQHHEATASSANQASPIDQHGAPARPTVLPPIPGAIPNSVPSLSTRLPPNPQPSPQDSSTEHPFDTTHTGDPVATLRTHVSAATARVRQHALGQLGRCGSLDEQAVRTALRSLDAIDLGVERPPPVDTLPPKHKHSRPSRSPRPSSSSDKLQDVPSGMLWPLIPAALSLLEAYEQPLLQCADLEAVVKLMASPPRVPVATIRPKRAPTVPIPQPGYHSRDACDVLHSGPDAPNITVWSQSTGSASAEISGDHGGSAVLEAMTGPSPTLHQPHEGTRETIVVGPPTHGLVDFGDGRVAEWISDPADNDTDTVADDIAQWMSPQGMKERRQQPLRDGTREDGTDGSSTSSYMAGVLDPMRFIERVRTGLLASAAPHPLQMLPCLTEGMLPAQLCLPLPLPLSTLMQ